MRASFIVPWDVSYERLTCHCILNSWHTSFSVGRGSSPRKLCQNNCARKKVPVFSAKYHQSREKTYRQSRTKKSKKEEGHEKLKEVDMLARIERLYEGGAKHKYNKTGSGAFLEVSLALSAFIRLSFRIRCCMDAARRTSGQGLPQRDEQTQVQ